MIIDDIMIGKEGLGKIIIKKIEIWRVNGLDKD